MAYDRDRVLGRQWALQFGATKTAAAIEAPQSCFADIFATAIKEVGLDTLVAHLQKAPPLWAHKALLSVPNLGQYSDTLAKRAAEAPDGVLSPGKGTAPPAAVAASSLAVKPGGALMGGPLSSMVLHNGEAATVQATIKWMDKSVQPNAEYSDWNDWLWTGDITAGSSSDVMKVADYAAHVRKCPINRGDTVWIYVWVAAGADLDGSVLLTSYQFTYDPGSTMQAVFVSTGTTYANHALAVQAYQAVS